jgi:hypothetical protein
MFSMAWESIAMELRGAPHSLSQTDSNGVVSLLQ